MSDDHTQKPEHAGDDEAVDVEARVEVGDGPVPGTAETAAAPAAERDGDDAAATPASDVPKDARQMAMFCHLLGLANYVVPFGGVIGPLVLWQMKREEHQFIDQQGRSALNFNITVAIAVLCCIPLIFVLVGTLLIPVIAIAANVCSVLAGIAANEGKNYKYPITFDFVK